MCVHIYVCIYVKIHAYICGFVYMYMYTYMGGLAMETLVRVNLTFLLHEKPSRNLNMRLGKQSSGGGM